MAGILRSVHGQIESLSLDSRAVHRFPVLDWECLAVDDDFGPFFPPRGRAVLPGRLRPYRWGSA